MTPPIVKRYLIAFDQHKWTGLGAFLLIVGASGVVALQPTPPAQYQADGTMIYTQAPVTFSKTGTDIQQQAQQTLTKDNLLTESVIKSAAERVQVKPKDLLKNLGLKLPAAPTKAQPNPPQIFSVQYTSNDPKEATAVVDTLMAVMVEQSRAINSQRLHNIMNEIQKRLPQAEKELRQAEQLQEQYIKREGTALLAARNGSLIKGITDSQAQQRQVQLQMQGIEAQIRSLQQQLGLTPDQAYTSSALSNDPIIANLRVQIYQTESQLALLSKNYRAEHPNMIALRKQQQTYEQLLRERASEVIGGNGLPPLVTSSKIRQDSSLDPARQQWAQQLVGLKTQRDTLQQQQLTLARQEQQLRREFATIPNKQLEQGRLQQKVALKQDLYSKMQAALVDAQAAEAETISSLSIIKPAKPSELPQESKNFLVIVGIGAFVGIAVGGGLIFLLGSLGGMLQTMEDIRAALVQRDLAVLGTLPYMLVLDPEGNELPVVVEVDSPYLELYERFRSNLRRASDEPLKVVMFTSTVNQEGKSLSAYNLAIASARAGKRTLLIEADLRSPSLAKAVKVAPDPDASVEPLRYYSSLSECVRLVPEVENLYLIPSPGPVRQPAAILESSELRRLLDDARGRFDMVILDSPALSLCNDALLLEPLADGMILVTRPGYTGGNLLAEVIERLESDEVQLLGAIINGADMHLPTPTTIESPLEESLAESESLEDQQTKAQTGGRRK